MGNEWCALLISRWREAVWKLEQGCFRPRIAAQSLRSMPPMFRTGHRSLRTPNCSRRGPCHSRYVQETNTAGRSADRMAGRVDVGARSSMSEHVRSLKYSPCDSDSYQADSILYQRSIVESGGNSYTARPITTCTATKMGFQERTETNLMLRT